MFRVFLSKCLWYVPVQAESCAASSAAHCCRLRHCDFLSSGKNHGALLFSLIKQASSSKLLRRGVGDNSCSIGEVHVPRHSEASTSHMQCRLLRSTQSACHAACQPLTQTKGTPEPVQSDVPAQCQHSTGMPDSVLTSITTSTGELNGARRRPAPAPDVVQNNIHRSCQYRA